MLHWYIIALLYGIVFAFACHYIAGEKGKDQTTWAVIGFFLGIIGLLIIGFSEKEVKRTEKTYSQSTGKLSNGAEIRDGQISTFVMEEPPWIPICIDNDNCANYSWPDGGVYVGEARVLTHGEKDSLIYERHGKGEHAYSSGAKYSGEWMNDKENGKGTFCFADGAIYIGDFKNGMFHGGGIITSEDGSVKSGSWENGHYVGEKYNQPATHSGGAGGNIKMHAEQYEGEYKNGVRHGWGTYVYPSGATYVGEWENDMENGRGTFTLIDGTVYVGEFKAGKFHGSGILTYADGRKQSGEWEFGRRIK